MEYEDLEDLKKNQNDWKSGAGLLKREEKTLEEIQKGKILVLHLFEKGL